MVKDIFNRFNGFPTLENLWRVMDEIWKYDCDPKNLDHRVNKFYSHPIWLYLDCLLNNIN